MSTQSQNNKRIDQILTLIIIGLLLGLPYIINLCFQYIELIDTRIQDKDWLSFWSNYIPGILACGFAYLAIIKANQNNQDVIKQQNRILKEQEFNNIKFQYNEAVKDYILCFKMIVVEGFLFTLNNSNKTDCKEYAYKIASNYETVSHNLEFLIDKYPEESKCFELFISEYKRANNFYSKFISFLFVFVKSFDKYNEQEQLFKLLQPNYDINLSQEDALKANLTIQYLTEQMAKNDLDVNKVKKKILGVLNGFPYYKNILLENFKTGMENLERHLDKKLSEYKNY